MEKNFEAEGREFAKFIRTVQFKVRTNFETECFFNLFLKFSQVKYHNKIRVQIWKSNWDLETCRMIPNDKSIKKA